MKILSLSPPAPILMTSQEETTELWTRFCGAVHDSLTKSASRTLPSFQHSCQSLWPRFIAPIIAGSHTSREFSKLLIASRGHFQDEALLNPSIISVPSSGSTTAPVAIPLAKQSQSSSDLATLLPIVARLLLLAAYLASHNASRHDLTVFSTFHNGKKKKRGGYSVSRGRSGTKHRKIARKLLGAHSFVMERMMAIFVAVRNEWAAAEGVGSSGLDGDIGLAIATLASLQLLVRVGLAADPMDRSARWRINAGWETIRAVGRSIGVEVEDWLVE